MPPLNLFAFLDLSPMSGDDLRTLRGRLSELLGRTIRQGDLSGVFGTNQTGYGAWELKGPEPIPHRVAMVARLLEAHLTTLTTPPALRPEVSVLEALAELTQTVADSYEPGAPPVNALRVMGLASAPPVVAWLGAFRTATAPEAPEAEPFLYALAAE